MLTSFGVVWKEKIRGENVSKGWIEGEEPNSGCWGHWIVREELCWCVI